MATRSEIKEALDWSVIRYSRVHEDHRVLSQALQVLPEEDVVLSITSAGDNVLNLLLDRPKKIVAIDLSPAQNALLELKLAAIARLPSYHDFVVLLGEVEEDSTSKRLDLYAAVRDTLPIYAQEYWDSHKELLASGVADSGRLEKYVRTYATEHFPKFADQKWVERFTNTDSLEEQKQMFESLDIAEFSKDFIQYMSKESQTKGRSSTQLKYVEESRMADTWQRLYRACTELPVKGNYYIGNWFQRKQPFNPSSVPPYLTPEGFTKLKGLIDRVEVVTMAVEDYLSSCPVFQKANMSDVFEYLSPEASTALFAALASKMSDQGRVAFWEAYVPRASQAGPQLKHLAALSRQLHSQDRLFYYCGFHVMQVDKAAM